MYVIKKRLHNTKITKKRKEENTMKNATIQELRHALEIKTDYLCMYRHRLPNSEILEIETEIREIRNTLALCKA